MWKKIITWHIPISIIGTVVAFTGILWLINPEQYADPGFHLLAGGIMLGAIFMATDMVTSPMTKGGQLLFGFGVGLLTILIRMWGAYPEGVSFSILIMILNTPPSKRVRFYSQHSRWLQDPKISPSGLHPMSTV